MKNLSHLKQSLLVSDQLIQLATKEDIAECARLLAINIAHYQSVYGEVDLDKTLQVAYSEEPNETQLILMNNGMETLIGILGAIVGGFDEKINH